MDIQCYVQSMKEVYKSIIKFIDCEDDEIEPENFSNIIFLFDYHEVLENDDRIYEILKIINHILKNKHRNPSFFKKIQQILSYLKTKIKQTFSNIQIFDLFKHNKRLLYFLIKDKILDLNEEIIQSITADSFQKFNYKFYFFNEIQNSISPDDKKLIKDELSSKYLKTDEIQDEKCQIGENDSYICTLIRNDSIKEFVSYVNRKNISLSSKIENSIYETNSFLIDKKPFLIEYSAFFGSIQIFQFLRINKAKLTSSLWLYAIHSNNPDLIHILEENQIVPDDNQYSKCFEESIKCHHNEIAHYLYDNYEIEQNYFLFGFRYHNYEFIPIENISNKMFFKYLCQYDYITLVKLFVENKIFDVNDKINENGPDVTAIKIAAEKNNSKIVNYLLLERGKEILPSEFKNCFKLREITIPPLITSIGGESFSGCSSLTKINIPSSVDKIENNTFFECSSLAQIMIPSSVTSIGDFAYGGCSSLTEITIPSSVMSIKKGVFFRCTSLAQIKLPSSITSIEEFAFYDCSSLTEITIPSSVTSIEIYTFKGCSSLKTITIPSSVTSIGGYSFNECSSLTEISIPSSVTSIGENAFDGCSSLMEISIPSSITEISNDTFSKCTSLNQITIPSSVTLIQRKAFSKCSSLKQITIPPSITSIGENAFEGCSSLSQITIPSSLKAIEDSTFNLCSSIVQITVPDSVTSIGKSAFCGCSSLSQITIPSSVESIGESAFSGCSSLTQITVPSSVSLIDVFCFSGCTKLTEVSLPPSLTAIKSGAFFRCSSLKNVSIPSLVTEIGFYAFNGCSSLTQISIPPSVTEIGDDAFTGCSSLKKISLPSFVNKYQIGIRNDVIVETF